MRGYAALHTGKFPLAKDRAAVERRLDGKIKTGKALELLCAPKTRAWCRGITTLYDTIEGFFS